MLKSQKISAYKIYLFAYSLGGNRVARYPSEKLPFILGVYTLMTNDTIHKIMNEYSQKECLSRGKKAVKMGQYIQ